MTATSTTDEGGAPRWLTPAGEIIGRRDGDVLRASGIRYARAGRFERPTPEPASETRIDATRPAPACPQPRMEFTERALGITPGELDFDEDCLRLTVVTPAAAGPDRASTSPTGPARPGRPVMVMIHGGSYTSGAGDLSIYDPAPLVAEQDVVVVNVTYRLGTLGYLGDGTTRPANLGLLDQIEALRWVRTNIAAFGGDPDAVTVFGQSTGGDAAAHLMIARGAEGLFHRAIVQSPPFGVMPDRSAMATEMMRAAESLTTEADVDEVLAAQPGVAPPFVRHGLRAGMPFGVQYGHDPLPAEEDLDAAWSEAARRVEVLIGSTDREAAFFVGKAAGDLPRRRWSAPLRPLAAPLVRRLVATLTDRIYGRGVLAFAERHHRADGRGQRYLITWGVPGNPYAGAHTIELPLLFGRPETWQGAEILAGVDPAELRRAGRRLRELWAGFARSGHVGTVSEPGLIEVRDLPVR